MSKKADQLSIDDASVDGKKKSKISFPSNLYYIIGNEFCERFSFYGMHTVLILYLTIFLKFDKDIATIIYHTFIALCYFFPLIGAIIADSKLGKYKTILYLSVVYTAGMVLNAISAIPDLGGYGDSLSDNMVHVVVHLVGLTLIAIGTGGIKPCVSAFGGDQFEEGEEESLSAFFSFFYFAINAGSLVSTFVSPLLREKASCFDREDCYFAAFMLPAGLMVVSIILFMIGRKKYTIREPEGNVFSEFCSISWNALRNKCKASREVKKLSESWLDFAKGNPKWSDRKVEDIKFVYPVAVVFLPLPFFWALFDMQGSRWTLTAAQCNGYIFGDNTDSFMLPDHAQMINPILILILIPIFQLIYPCVDRSCCRVTDLRKMSLGMVISSLAFVISGFVQIAIETELTVVPKSNQYSTVFYNPYASQNIFVKTNYFNLEIEPMGRTSSEELILTPPTNSDVFSEEIEYSLDGISWMKYDVQNERGEINHHRLPLNDEQFDWTATSDKSQDGKVIFDFINPTNFNATFSFQKTNKDWNSVDLSPKTTSQSNDPIETLQGEYIFKATAGSCKMVDPVDQYVDFFKTGSIWSIVLFHDEQRNECQLTFFKDNKENKVSLLALIPQFAVITIAEVLISVTGLEFAYTQAPPSMKSVLQSFWLLTVCFGNIIDIFIVSIDFTELQSTEYFVFAALVFVAAIVFILIAIFYYEYVPEGQFSQNVYKGDDNDAFDDFEKSALEDGKKPIAPSNDDFTDL
ncbi:unnamed protein product [Oikopleura dioica]|uniref:Uncharacterized protein n=1 Tax=Oikopleura dioica TaxID=34765 RepID=E4YFA4_OIKDI|nr:unnamed protein product [Oikopleura dioica]